MTDPQDPQQEKVYRAGSLLRRERAEFMAQSQVLDFVEYATSHPWWLARSDTVSINVAFTEEAHVSATSEWSTGLITLPPWAMNRSTLTHELTHQLLGRYHPEQDFELQPHGPVFAATWLGLVQQTVPDMHLRMRELFQREGVVFDASKETPPNDRRVIALRARSPSGVLNATTAYTPEAMQCANWPDMRKLIVDGLRETLERRYACPVR